MAETPTARSSKSPARAGLFVVGLALVGAFVVWSLWLRAPEPLRFEGPIFGTTYHVTVVGESEGRRTDLGEGIVAALESVDASMSSYRDDSEVRRLSEAEAGPFEASEMLIGVLANAARVSEESEGAFDVTVAPLVDAWGFGPGDEPAGAPSAQALDAARSRVGWSLLRVEDGKVMKAKSGVQVDLGAIAKGYGADRVSGYLDRAGVANYMVEVGGEVRVRGTSPAAQPWRVGIEQPTNAALDGQTVHGIVTLRQGAMATSGDYRNYREIDGRRVSHTIDPVTGAPIEHGLASVTVVHDSSCTLADAYATALNVMGPDRARAFAEEHGLAVHLVIRNGPTAGDVEGFETWTSPTMEEILDIPEPRDER